MLTEFLSCCKCSATKCVSLNNEPCMTRPFLFDLNPAELKYFPFKITLIKCNWSCNDVDELSTKICLPNKIKQVNNK